jgi:hypothetical protein
MLAWETSAHYDFSNEAGASIRDFLPPGGDVRDRLLKIFDELPSDVDVTDWTLEQFSDTAFVGLFLSREGQATHFMANKGQPQWQAFQVGKEGLWASRRSRETVQASQRLLAKDVAWHQSPGGEARGSLTRSSRLFFPGTRAKGEARRPVNHHANFCLEGSRPARITRLAINCGGVRTDWVNPIDGTLHY